MENVEKQGLLIVFVFYNQQPLYVRPAEVSITCMGVWLEMIEISLKTSIFEGRSASSTKSNERGRAEVIGPPIP